MFAYWLNYYKPFYWRADTFRENCVNVYFHFIEYKLLFCLLGLDHLYHNMHGHILKLSTKN